MSHEHNIIHTDGDFFQVQNYALQLLSENRISPPAFILYCFYKSTAGFSQINYSYEFISRNSGISKGSITKGIKQLEEEGLVEVTRYGANKTFDIKIIPGSNLPRRILKQIERSGPLFEGFKDPSENFEAQKRYKDDYGKKKPRLPTQSMRDDVAAKYSKGKDFDPNKLSKEAKEFWEIFTTEWKKKCKTKFYPRNDLYKITEIQDFEEAKKLVPVLWVLDETDEWVKTSDHSLSVFIHCLNMGKLQALYPKTSFYYKDSQV